MKSFFYPNLILFAVSVAPGVSWATEGQLVVPTLSTTAVAPEVAPVVTELVLEALLTRHRLPALGPADLKDMLDVEQQRQLLGCDDSRCLSELAGALGSARLVSGLIGRLGEQYVVTLKLVDLSSAQVLSRSSTRFARLEDAPEAIGPLVDALVGAKPATKVDGRPLIAQRKEAEASAKAASVDAFCGARITACADVLATGRGNAPRIDARRKVLMDLLLTPFLTELEDKLACLRSLGQKEEARLHASLRSAATAVEATNSRRALAEWQELTHGARLVEEVYRMGLDREKHGSGARPTALTFVLRPGLVPARRPAAESFVKTFEAAQTAVAAACAAVRDERRADFVALFGPKDKAGRPDPRDLYVARLGESEAARLDACPAFVLDDADLEARAKDYADRKVVRGCARYIRKKDGAPVLRDVQMQRVDGGFRIIDWSKLDP